MSDIYKRDTLVNFRLTFEEYEKLKLASSVCGAHSLSDFVRGAVLRSVNSANGANNHSSNLEGRIAALVVVFDHRYLNAEQAALARLAVEQAHGGRHPPWNGQNQAWRAGPVTLLTLGKRGWGEEGPAHRGLRQPVNNGRAPT